MAEALEMQLVNGENRNPWTPYENLFLKRWLPLRWRLVWPFSKKRFKRTVSIGEMIVIVVLLGLLGAAGAMWGSGHGNVGGSGQLAAFAMTVVFILATHNSLITIAVGLAFERALEWHMWFADAAIVLSAYHGILAQRDADSKDPFKSTTFVTGWVSTAAMVLLWITARVWIRRRFFVFFQTNHWVFFIIAGVFALLHGAGLVALGFVLFGLDGALRIFLYVRGYRPRKAHIQQLPCDIVQLTFEKGRMHYEAGQYVFICVPELTIFEYHPFTISSSPHQTQLTVHIRVLGDWTKKLHALASQKQEVKVWFDGPVGEVSLDIYGTRYKHFLLVSGGIGITPMQSITNELLYQANRGRPVESIHFVWSVQDRFMIDALKEKPTHLPMSFTPDLVMTHAEQLAASSDSSKPPSTQIFKPEYYLTRVRSAEERENANIRPEEQPYLKFGRPDIAEIATRVAREANGAPVAVLTCGPKGMVHDVEKMCKNHPNFDLHKELFDF